MRYPLRNHPKIEITVFLLLCLWNTWIALVSDDWMRLVSLGVAISCGLFALILIGYFIRNKVSGQRFKEQNDNC